MNKLLVVIILCAFSSKALSAIYADDELAYANENNQYGRSILAQLRTDSLIEKDSRHFIKTKSLDEHIKNMCEDTPFKTTPTYSRCSAFLVAPDLIVTAGHCINSQSECEQATWVFTSETNPLDPQPEVEKRDIVKCEKVVSRIKNSISKNDYALLKITKSVNHRPTLEFRNEGRIDSNSELVVIGHPSGLPLISTDQGHIIDNNSDILFKITSDTFGGNSGSPVINLKTGIVEGILTDGDLDYVLDQDRGCMTTYKCLGKECKGENVVRITNIPELVPGMTPKEPIFDPRFPRL